MMNLKLEKKCYYFTKFSREMADSGKDTMESRGKSWKREREERGRKQAVQQDENGKKDLSQSHSGSGLLAETDKKADKFDPKNSADESGEKTQEPIPEEKETTDTTSEEQRRELQQYIKELTEKLRLKAGLRAVNTSAESTRPEESFFSKLDSSLKKNTAFIKRLRNMTEMQRDSLIKDMEGLNLTKYISEAAAAIVDAKLKMSDVSTAVQVCSLLHRRYADFSAQLLEHWQKVLPMKKDEKISNPSKIRVDLRFYAELVSSGIFPLKEGLPLLGNLLTVLTHSDKEEHSNVGILLSFCRHCGEDYTGIVPRKYRLLSEKYQIELPKSDAHELPPEKLKQRDVVFIDIANDTVESRDYKETEDPTKFKSEKTGRGPLVGNWQKTCTPIMCAYKLVTVEFKWFGLQNRVESFIQKTERRIFLNFHRQVFCWLDRWHGMTMKDIRDLEDKTKRELDEQRNKGHVRGTQEI